VEFILFVKNKTHTNGGQYHRKICKKSVWYCKQKDGCFQI